MEGVLGDLSADEARDVADELRSQPGCEWWVIDYFSQRLLAHYRKHQPHPKAPVRFDPPELGGVLHRTRLAYQEIRFLGEESERLHRPVRALATRQGHASVYVSTASGHGLREHRADSLRRLGPPPRNSHAARAAPTQQFPSFDSRRLACASQARASMREKLAAPARAREPPAPRRSGGSKSLPSERGRRTWSRRSMTPLDLPTGILTFLFTDIEGSTRLLQDLGSGYAAVQDNHALLMRQAISEAGGTRTYPPLWSRR